MSVSCFKAEADLLLNFEKPLVFAILLSVSYFEVEADLLFHFLGKPLVCATLMSANCFEAESYLFGMSNFNVF